MKCSTFALIFVCFGSQAAIAQHLGDIWVGVSGSNQLKVISTMFECEKFLDASSNPGIFPGWISIGSDNTGFDHIRDDDPENDLYAMQGNHNIHLELISIKNYVNGQDMTGFYVVNPVSFMFMDEPGDSLLLGSSDLHIHFVWYLNDNENKAPWGYAVDPDWFGRIEATFKLTDSSYADSEPFTMVFTNDEYMIADIDQDQTINLKDFAVLASKWLQSGCVLPDRCQRTDINQDGQVGLEDLFWLTRNWLKNDPDCSL